MGIWIAKLFAQLLFWLYDFIDTIGAIFNLLTGTQNADSGRTLLEIFVDSAISTKVLIGLCAISVVIAGACVGVKIVKNVVQIKAGGEQSSHATALKQGCIAIISSVACIFFVFLFIAFSSMLLNMVNSVIAPSNNFTLSQNLFNLSVEQSYVLDESHMEERYVDYFDEYGNRVQEEDPNSPDGLKWEFDENGVKVPVYKKKVEYYYPYLKDENGNLVMQTGWVEGYTVNNINWAMSPDQVFGIHNKDWVGMFELEDQGYQAGHEPIVRLEAFNMFTAYLVAVIMLVSMFMLCLGLVKRIYDIIVLIICMPLVCGTIPLDDGARFRAWRETFMSKVLIAFGAVIALNVFFMISNYILSPSFNMEYLITEGVLDSSSLTIFKMLLLLGGAVCMNGSQTLVARILGTSADEGREAMQSFALITSGVRMAAVGALGVGRVAAGAGRMVIGGTNRYGRERTGILNYAARGVNSVAERYAGEKYTQSRGAAFVRALGRMGGRPFGNGGNVGKTVSENSAKPGAAAPYTFTGLSSTESGGKSFQPLNGSLRSNSASHKSSAYNDTTKRGK